MINLPHQSKTHRLKEEKQSNNKCSNYACSFDKGISIRHKNEWNVRQVPAWVIVHFLSPPVHTHTQLRDPLRLNDSTISSSKYKTTRHTTMLTPWKSLNGDLIPQLFLLWANRVTCSTMQPAHHKTCSCTLKWIWWEYSSCIMFLTA